MILACGAVAVLAFAANLIAAALLAFAIFFYVVVYTMWLKRSTPQNIVIGGAAGALPPVIGWAAAGGQLAIEPFVLFLIVFLWTPPHFWALSLNRTDEYARAGVPMLPVVAGKTETKRQIPIYSTMLLPISLLPWAWICRGILWRDRRRRRSDVRCVRAEIDQEQRGRSATRASPVRIFNPLPVCAVRGSPDRQGGLKCGMVRWAFC